MAAESEAPVRSPAGTPMPRRYWIASRSPVAAASVISRSSSSAPLFTRSFKTGVDPKVVRATLIGVAPRLPFTFTSAPASSNTRVFAKLVAAYINAVESREFFILTLAPLSISSFIIFTSDSMTECIKAVVPSLSTVFTSAPVSISFRTCA